MEEDLIESRTKPIRITNPSLNSGTLLVPSFRTLNLSQNFYLAPIWMYHKVSWNRCIGERVHGATVVDRIHVSVIRQMMPRLVLELVSPGVRGQQTQVAKLVLFCLVSTQC